MSLRTRILLLVLAASVLPVLAMFWLLLESRAVTGAQAREQLVARSEVLARELDDRIAGTVQLLFGLARVPVVGSEDVPACSSFLADVLKEHPQYTGFLTIQPDGRLHCDSLRSGRRLMLADRDYFRRALGSQGAVVEPVIGRLTGKGVLQIAYPVRTEGGDLRYILLASLDMQTYGQKVAQALPYKRMHFQVWNRDGSIIMDYPGPESEPLAVEAGQRRFMLESATSGSQTLGAGADARIWVKAALPRWPEAGLRLALSVPEEDFHERIDGQFKRALAGLIGLTLLIFSVAAVLGEFALRRQTARLMQAISRMDGGDFTQPIGAPYPRDELGQVMQVLDKMSASLEEQRQEIARNTEALEHQANIDALTGLANRYMLADRLKQALVYAWRGHRVVGVLMLDLDRFKMVNDSLGHSQGDLLLQTVASRLRSCVRDGDTVARLGGDEFVIVMADMGDSVDIVPVARHILDALAEPVRLGTQTLTVNTSIGIAVYPRDGESADTLLQYADTAMYQAKERGGNGMAFYAPEMMQATLDRLTLEAGLRRALAEGELRLHYQPIVDAASGRVTSAEALLRWQDPARGLVPPLQFVPIAEETGLIIPIGDWVLREACAQARRWLDEGLGQIPVAVNLSPRQFSGAALAESVAQALATTGCPAALLQLEITESSVMDQVERALASMHRLTAMGVRLAIDDFGTGYSSLSQLKRFPVFKLKIDRAFIRDIGAQEDDVLVDAIITLARKLGLRTVAEGVETPEQRAFLESKGCDEFQGYLFSRPCDAEAFANFVRGSLLRSGAT